MNNRKIQDKIKTRDELALLVAQWRQEGKKVGFTSGSFDIVHGGHISYLEKAKEKCDILIVAVNSDLSVQSYKGPDRPLVPGKYRLMLLAGLECVDYVFMFDERRNRTNLEVIKPSYYIKAGDYKPEELTSSDAVEKYGGEIMLLPLEEGLSTTALIEKILRVFGQKKEDVPFTKTEVRKQQKAILVDRDGTINVDIEYLHEPERFKLLPHVGEGLKKMQDLGYKIIVVTTQAGIGLGYFSKEDFYKVNREMFMQLKPYGVIVDKIYFATHAKTADGKNPKVGLFERAREEADLDLKQCIAIGDKTGDLDAGKQFECKTIAVQTGHACQDKQYQVIADFVATDLLDAALWIEKHQ